MLVYNFCTPTWRPLTWNMKWSWFAAQFDSLSLICFVVSLLKVSRRKNFLIHIQALILVSQKRDIRLCCHGIQTPITCDWSFVSTQNYSRRLNSWNSRMCPGFSFVGCIASEINFDDVTWKHTISAKMLLEWTRQILLLRRVSNSHQLFVFLERHLMKAAGFFLTKHSFSLISDRIKN